MTVCEIVAEYLERNGYEGLAGNFCGCRLADLMPCQELGPTCEAGHVAPCDCEDACPDWMIVPGLPDKQEG